MKRSVVLLFIGLFLFSFLISIETVSATWTQDVTKFFDENVFGGLKDAGFQKVLVLFIIVGIIFSALGFMGLPDNAAIRFILSIAAGVLVTSLISLNEITAAMQSSKALGITIILGFPIMIMCAITLQIAIKGHFMGIMVQRFLWLIYSLYLFLISAGSYLSSLSSGTFIYYPIPTFCRRDRIFIGIYHYCSSSSFNCYFLVYVCEKSSSC